ncbi:MAG: hypothetical protein Q4E99_02670 [Bacillota bacterium]|nr:hypothetical protein [Bacillota bacterium]
MKQIIVMLCSLILGILLVNMIIGNNGIGEKAERVWQNEYELRSSAFAD